MLTLLALLIPAEPEVYEFDCDAGTVEFVAAADEGTLGRYPTAYDATDDRLLTISFRDADERVRPLVHLWTRPQPGQDAPPLREVGTGIALNWAPDGSIVVQRRDLSDDTLPHAYELIWIDPDTLEQTRSAQTKMNDPILSPGGDFAIGIRHRNWLIPGPPLRVARPDAFVGSEEPMRPNGWVVVLPKIRHAHLLGPATPSGRPHEQPIAVMSGFVPAEEDGTYLLDDPGEQRIEPASLVADPPKTPAGFTSLFGEPKKPPRMAVVAHALHWRQPPGEQPSVVVERDAEPLLLLDPQTQTPWGIAQATQTGELFATVFVQTADEHRAELWVVDPAHPGQPRTLLRFPADAWPRGYAHPTADGRRIAFAWDPFVAESGTHYEPNDLIVERE